MKRQWGIALFVCLLSLGIWFGCSEEKVEKPLAVPEPGEETLKTVYVVNYPLKYFADRIADGKVEVVFPAPADQDPAFWMPDAKTIEAYQNADLILLNGATYAKWVGKVTLPESKIVNTSLTFKDKYLRIEHAVTHSHGPGGVHSHAGTDFNTWLDPNLAIIQAQAVKDALVKLVPEESATFEKNFETLKQELLELDRNFKRLFAGKENTPVVASHPVYGYFAKAYNLNLKALLWEPQEMPPEAEWKHLDEILKKHPAKWMIWEGKPSTENVAKLKEHGLDGVVFDPCGNVPEEGDYMRVMRQNTKRLEAIYK